MKPRSQLILRCSKNTTVLMYLLTVLLCCRGPGPNASRQAINEATSFLDASCLYGEDENVTQAIRAGMQRLLLLGHWPAGKQPLNEQL